MKTVAELLKLKGSQRQEVYTVPKDHTVFEALIVMASKNVGALPVVDEHKNVVGIISERDYARKVILKGLSSITTKVHEIMSAEPITVGLHDTVEACMSIMTDKHLRHLPVVEDGKLIGLLSIGDLVKESIAEQADLIRQLEQYIRGE